MKSSVSILGITRLVPVLNELEELGAKGNNMERIKELNLNLVLVCGLAMDEVAKALPDYM
jgi:hypothetical protein